MTYKEKIHQILSSLWKNDDSVGKTYYNQALQDVQAAIDLQEKPKKCMYSKDNFTDEDRKVLCDGCEEECEHAQNQEHVSEDLGEYISELSKQFPEVSFAKLSRIAVRVARWQKEHMDNNIELYAGCNE